MAGEKTLETGFRGLWAGSDPERQPAGSLQTADNVFISGHTEEEGGAATIRPGVRGQLSATVSALFNAHPYRKASGQQNVFFAAGNFSNSAGRILQWVKDEATGTYLTTLGAYAETAVRFARLDKYLFITGATGTTGVRMKRYDPETGVVIDAEGIATPSYAPTASRVNTPVNDVSGTGVFTVATRWAADRATATIGVTQSTFLAGSFTGKTAGEFLCPGTTAWLVAGPGTVEVHTAVWAAYPATIFVGLDEPGSGFKTDPSAYYTNQGKLNTNGVGAGSRKSVAFNYAAYYMATGVNDEISASLVAYDNSNAEIARQLYVHRNETTGVVGYQRNTFSFAGVVDDTEIAKLGLEFVAGNGNNAASSGPYITFINLDPLWYSSLSGSVEFAQGTTGTVEVRALDSLQSDTAGVFIGDQRIAYDTGVTADYSTKSNIAVEFASIYAFDPSQVRLGLRQGTATTAFYTNDLEYARDESGKTYLVGDISVISKTDRTAIRYLELYFPGDLTMPEGVGANRGQSLFSIGRFTEAGGLQSGLTYDWLFTEKEFTSGIISGGGPISNPVQATTYEASGLLNLTGVTLPSSTAANRLVPYRRGGTADGWWHKVGEFNPAANATGTYWVWDATARTFLDKTPDSVIERSPTGDIDELFSDHVTPPTDVLEVSTYAGRLILFTRDAVWASQPANVQAATGLYFNRVENRADPNFPNQGFYTRITGSEGQNAGDTVQRAIPYQEILATFFTNGIYIFGGTDASDFYFRHMEGDDGAGLISPYAIGVYNGLVYYLSQDGLRQFDGLRTDVVSNSIRRLLNPKSDFYGANLSASAYRQSSFIGNAERLYLSTPATGGTVVSSTFVFDTRPGVLPVRWTIGEVGGWFTLDSATDTDDLYGFTHNSTNTSGMIFRISQEYGDKTRLVDGVTAVVGTIRSRGYTAPGGGDLGVNRLGMTITCSDAPTASFKVTGENNVTAKQWTGSYILGGGGDSARRLLVPRRVDGRFVDYEISVTGTTSPVTINRAGLTDTEGRPLI